ncbi:Coiled-coil domain-containing protein 94 [Toxocara canis]|uniref:Splicing factor YJU2 n=1 Tax=Toxocara canis TaxID=6265 RepID=A0A0B2V9Q5_TOXCA|nr:Coiled-coil domain-containing protein 94 [Toxocara canis]
MCLHWSVLHESSKEVTATADFMMLAETMHSSENLDLIEVLEQGMISTPRHPNYDVAPGRTRPLNKYYPPDFDPSKIPRAKGQRNRQFVQRVMAPFNMQCNTCHEYIYKGKKFNMRRETAEGEFYLGLKIFRFYFRCPNCLAEITFKTDLENCDYQQEHGATRLFEAFKLYQQEEKAKETQEEEDKKDPMKMLEKRTKMSRAEMEAMGKLEELQEINRRHEAFDPDKYLENQRMLQAEELRLQEEKDEEFIRSLYGRTTDGKVIKRILDDSDEEHPLTATTIPPIHVKQEKPEDDDGEKPCCSTSATKEPFKEPSKPSTQSLTNKRPIESSQKQILSKAVIVKKKKPAKEEDADNELRLQEEKDEEFIRSLYGRTTDGKVIKRILDDSDEEHPLTATTIPPIHVKQEKPEDDDGEKPCCSTSATKEPFKEPSKPSTQSLTNKRPIESSQKQILSKAVIVKKKKPAKEEDADNVIKREVIVRIKEEQPESSNADESVDSTVTSEDSKATLQGPSLPSNALLGLADYGSDSSSD